MKFRSPRKRAAVKRKTFPVKLIGMSQESLDKAKESANVEIVSAPYCVWPRAFSRERFERIKYSWLENIAAAREAEMSKKKEWHCRVYEENMETDDQRLPRHPVTNPQVGTKQYNG